MIPTDAKQCHAIPIANDGSTWLLHDDNKLTIIAPQTKERETFHNVVFMWPESNTFLVNDTRYCHAQIWTRSSEKRFCAYEIPFAGRIQSDRAGNYLLLTSTVGSGLPMSLSLNPASSFSLNRFPAKTTICYNLKTDAEVWRHTFTAKPPQITITKDAKYTRIFPTLGNDFFYNNETGQFMKTTDFPNTFSIPQTPVSPVENGHYQSEQIICEYYDQSRDWFWLATGRVFILQRETLYPTVVTFQFNTLLQAINVFKDRYLFFLLSNIFLGKLNSM